jgi:hypothetical protein
MDFAIDQIANVRFGGRSSEDRKGLGALRCSTIAASPIDVARAFITRNAVGGSKRALLAL